MKLTGKLLKSNMNSYKALNKQTFTLGKHSIVPLRIEDRYAIMKWRNEQIYHLRQHKTLTREDQDKYFETTVAGLFKKDQPEQILFSYLESDICIGYGGLVHINWIDKNAEISFIMNTELEDENFEFHWSSFLKLLEELAFHELQFHKLYVYAFDLRPHLYTALELNEYFKDAVLEEHCFFNAQFIDVVVYSKLNIL
jgi:RimJ/RimL family protein N-acetyltransferase